MVVVAEVVDEVVAEVVVDWTFGPSWLIDGKQPNAKRIMNNKRNKRIVLEKDKNTLCDRQR